jgi:phosphatidylglycerol:prolipoprotein diacylglycerol transferase
MVNFLLLWMRFDVNPICFKIPFINHPIAWYGVIFAGSFYLGYRLFIWMHIRQNLNTFSIPKEFKDIKIPDGYKLSKKNQRYYLFFKKRSSDYELVEKLKLRLYLFEVYPKKIESIEKKSIIFSESALFYIIVATVVGARLGHIIFYENIIEFIYFPLDIFKTWEGGLASHGGIIGILLAAYIFVKKNKSLSFLTFMDLISAPTMFVCAFIRIGNLINQEILGSQTSAPWGIIFLNPADGSGVFPRHPIQIYEFILYIGVFIFIYLVWSKNLYKKITGFYTGIALSISFGLRFFLEFLKIPQSVYDQNFPIQIGQLLSIPMTLFGLFLIFNSIKMQDSLDKKRADL